MTHARAAIDEATTEDDLQEQVEALLTHTGWLWFHDQDARRNNAGLPDIVAVHPRTGITMFAELKVGTNRLSPAQEAWADALELGERKSQGVVRYYVVRPETFDRWRHKVTVFATTGGEG